MKQVVESPRLKPSTLQSCSKHFQADTGLPEVTIYPSDKLHCPFVWGLDTATRCLPRVWVKLMYFANTTPLWIKEDNHSINRVALGDGTSTGLLLQSALLQIENNVQSISNTKPAPAGGITMLV